MIETILNKSEVNNINIEDGDSFLVLYYPALIDLISFTLKNQHKIIIIRNNLEKREFLLQKWQQINQKIELYPNHYSNQNFYLFLKWDLWKKKDVDYILHIIKEKNIENVLTYYRYQLLLRKLKYLKKKVFLFDSFDREFMAYQYYNLGGYFKKEQEAIHRYQENYQQVINIGNTIAQYGKKNIKLLYILISEGNMYTGFNNVIVEYQKLLQKEADYVYMGLEKNHWQMITTDILKDINPDYIFYSFLTEQDKENNRFLDLCQQHRSYEIPYGMGSWEHNTLESCYLFLWISKIIYQDLLKDIPLKKILKEYYKKTYGLELTEEEIDPILQMNTNKGKENYEFLK